MIESIHELLAEIDSYYYSYCIESHTIVKTNPYENTACHRDLVLITTKLSELNIDFFITENKNIKLLEEY